MSKPVMVLVACCIAALFSNHANAQRPFAPGVFKVVEPIINGRDVNSLPMNLPGISDQYLADGNSADWKTVDDTKTLLGQTRGIVFHRDVFQHEFGHLGLRQLNVTASNLSGQLRDRNIFYLVFRIRNVGSAITHEEVEDPKYGHIDYEPKANPDKMRDTTLSTRFFGNFQLSGWVYDQQTRTYNEVTYADQVSPSITRLIQDEEDPDRPLLDKIQLAQTTLERVPVDSNEGGKWGVAIWYNVDPSLDFISVKVSGLTNAHRLEISPDETINFKHKTLQMNFYRPGDGIKQAEDRIDYGIPLNDDPNSQIEVTKRYHLPGPQILCEVTDLEFLRSTLIFEADADLDDIDFDSRVAESLDLGQIPESILNAFGNAGFELDPGASLTTSIPGQQWTVTDTAGGETRQFTLKLQPEFWEKRREGGIRFTKSLEYLWVYE